VLTRFHKPNIVKDIFFGNQRMHVALEHFRKAGSGVLVYLRDGAAGVPVAPLASRNRPRPTATSNGARSASARRSCAISASPRSGI